MHHSYCYDLRFRGEAAFVGYSQSVESKFREHLRHDPPDRELPLMISHSPNGWATANLMKSYLKWLSRRNEGRKCHLNWDFHSSHRDEEVKAYSVEKGINWQYVPVGQTGFWQIILRNQGASEERV